MKQLLMENQPSSLHEQHHLMFKHPYELLPFHEENIWDNEPALVNSPTLWASHQQQETLLNSPMSKCNLDHFLLKETHMSNSLYSNCVSDPWQSMSGDEIQQLERAGMSRAICSDHHYLGKNPQSLEEDVAYTIEEDATRCSSHLRSATMSNASLKNEPPSCMPSSSAFFGLKALNMQETRAPTCNLVPHVCKPSISSLLKPKAFNMEDNRAPCNLVPHASSASPTVSLSLQDQIMEMDHLMSLHDDGQSSLSDTASGIALVNASMLTSSPMFHMPEQLSSNFVQSQPFSSNLVQAPCSNNSVSHPSSTLAKLPSSSINYYHVNMENDQILKSPNHSSSLSLLAVSSIPRSLRDTKHYINLQHSSAPSSVPLSHPSTTIPGKLFHFANDQMMNNEQVQKNTEFSSSVSLNPVLNHRTSPKKHSMGPNQHSISLNEHSLSHNQHSSLSVRGLNDAHKSAPCSDAALERTISSMSSSSASDGDHHEPNEDPLEGTAKATMDDQVTVDQNSMNANEETKKLVQGEVHPSHIGDDDCSASHTPSLEALKIKKTSNKKGKKKKLQKRNRLPRIALVTQSENERLEDGFRWRKYGQKSVKNSPYPRSYYRCTTTMCSVKKRVERSPHDASMVITTYEGNHNHHTLPLARKSSISNDEYSYVNTTKPHLQCSLGRAPFATESFEYNYNANRYSLIMQLQDQHSYASSTYPPLPKLAYE